jgi:multidrug resistance efflux pump
LENEKSKVWDIMVKSDYLTEVLERTPAWIIRWGNTLFFVFIFGLIGLAAFIQYPDVIRARVELLTENPPIEVQARIAGQVDTLFYKDQDWVEKDDLLGRISSVADFQDVLRASEAVGQMLAIESLTAYIEASLPDKLKLGELNSSYSVLVKEFSDLQHQLEQDYVFKKIRSLEVEITKIRLLNESLKAQEEMQRQEVRLAETDFERNEQLHKEGVISDVELEANERDLLILKRAFENARMSQVENDLQIERLGIQKEELLNTRSETIYTRVSRLKELLNGLKGDIESWEENYLLFAPISGQLQLEPELSEGKPVMAGEALMNIIPPESDNRIIGVASMPSANSGEIEIGASVQVQLDAFPYQEYGVLEGTIVTISALSEVNENQQASSRVQVSFPDSLVTNYGQAVDFTQRMTGNALIVKEKRSVLARIFDQFSSIFE